ncbi:Crp/Fnr family transcriptional regulator [Rhodopseudomonas sp. AAP120]|uniref:Crp/Fnr family transcriptional regulator n=1 Tax=Rhodopseudomonas sp. AAP120 TaxID=1523430 RepID=UPI0006B9AC95|nr:Crp/Fnr family transcriptional regulator [Rhodopseudomonas sp. AAP120]KPF99892.1 Crp/Fnr family transcriptional regulator [Rhodopseudomonas sp. AAP120]
MVTSRQSPNDLLAALPSSDFDLLRPHLRTIDMDFGQVLVEAGAAVKQVIFPHAGIVSTMERLRRGETIEAGVIGRDSVVGSGAALYDVPAPSAAIVRFPGTASAIDASHFRTLVELSSALRAAVARDLWLRAVKAEQTAACNAAHSAEQRLCRRLLQSRAMSGSDAMLLSQDLMAQMLGVKRNTISLIAHALQQKGVIRYSRGRMAIIDVEALSRRACECHLSDASARLPMALRTTPVPLQRSTPDFSAIQRSPS